MKVILIFLLFAIIISIFTLRLNNTNNNQFLLFTKQQEQSNFITPLAGPTLKNW